MYERYNALLNDGTRRHNVVKYTRSKGDESDGDPDGSLLHAIQQSSQHTIAAVEQLARSLLSQQQPAQANSHSGTGQTPPPPPPPARQQGTGRRFVDPPRKPCPQCGQRGHWKSDCPEMPRVNHGATRPRVAFNDACFECGQSGHQWRNCPRLRQDQGNDNGPTSAPQVWSTAEQRN